MLFVESPLFTKVLTALMDDDEYRRLQLALVANPAAGVLIQDTGGLRKVRWGAAGRGKRGGVRVIYYWWAEKDRLLMLFAYPKGVQDDLTPDQRRRLSDAISREVRYG